MTTEPSNSFPEAATTSAFGSGSLAFSLRGLLGAAVGAALGAVIFQWLARQGFYAIMLPGALIGLGAGLAARRKSLTLGFLCAASAIVLAVILEWAVFPFVKDKSFSFFLAHLHELPSSKLVMMGLGGLFAYWFGQGR